MTELTHSISDENLRRAILAEFAAERRITSANIRVGVLNSIAHLAGAVDSLAERAVAEELAQGIEGIRGIVNRIEAPGAPSPSRTINLDLSPSQKDGSA
jgi:osmotically-inducible protein OsmY